MTSKFRNRLPIGFSLIELMIVITIIGILASIAIPAYNDYIIRSKIADMLSTSSTVKKAYSEYRIVKGTFALTATTLEDKLKELGLSTTLADNPTDMVTKVSVTPVSGSAVTKGRIDVCGNATNLGLNEGEILNLHFFGDWSVSNIKWSCQYSGHTDISKYVPSTCRTVFEGSSPCES